MADAHLSLSDYLTAVKMVIDDSFDHEVWVRAEIRAMNTKAVIIILNWLRLMMLIKLPQAAVQLYGDFVPRQ